MRLFFTTLFATAYFFNQQSMQIRLLSVALLLLILINFISCSTVSYTSAGTWANSTSEEQCSKFLCTNDGKHFWNSTEPTYKVYTVDAACQAIEDRGIKRIFFHGDSYMRHIYAAMMIFFKDDYRSGSLSEPENNKNCHYQRQFFEKRCNSQLLDRNGTVCNGKLYLDPKLHGLENLDHCKHENGTVNLWSFGNHKLSKGRYGVNNATAYQLFFNNICHSIATSSMHINGQYNTPCSTWWVSTHARRIGWFGDEFPEVVRDFNVGMREFFDSKKCGHVNYIDVHNMTSALVQELPSEAERLTFDNVHWGMEINLVKIQIILNALFQQTK